MKRWFILLFMLTSLYGEKQMSLYDFNATSIDGQNVSLQKYQGKVLLIVNVASKCAFTPQYEQLQALYEKYKEQGLAVLAFPCNQFRQQEPKSNEQIQEFCSINYGVRFDMFEKIDVNGDNTHPLYVYLKEQAKGIFGTQSIKWNFTKFLVSKDGKNIIRYSPSTNPSDFETTIKEWLSKD